ncbi:MAG TPA: SRPBCC family protein [Streptosporangiaceae bacterium]|nr:SRPBCC family protein [Streptosporangiaceae bacterium]
MSSAQLSLSPDTDYRGLMVTRLTLRAGVAVAADPVRVWDLVVDWHRQHEWILATSTEGGHGLGAKVTGRTALGPIGFTDPMIITEWSPPNRCIVNHLGPVVRGSGEFEVVPLAVGGAGAASPWAEFRWTERIDLPLPRGLGKLVVAAVVGPLARLGLGWSLRRFARVAATLTADQPGEPGKPG